jgi:cell wall-associated NlpC family hydrolase
VGAVVLFVVAALGVSVGVTGPAYATEYPSWQDVQRAKQNQATKKAEITKLTGYLASLEQQSAAAGKLALQRGEDYNVARDALGAATAKASALTDQADSALAQAHASAARVGQLVAQMARTGNGNLSVDLFLQGSAAGDLLSQLGMMSKLSQQSASVYQQAVLDRNTAQSLADEAHVAQTARAALASSAQAALTAANSAAAAVKLKVTEQKKLSTTMYAQLASLKGQTAKEVKGYLAGVAWGKAQEAKNKPPTAPPPANPPPGPPSGSKVDRAIAYAKAQLGEPYVLGGMGPSQWDCSGLTKAAYAYAGVYIGTHSATDQYDTMRADGKLVPIGSIQAGDLLWYSSGGSTSGSKYHVTLYIGGGNMIEAPYPGEVVRIRPVRYGDLVPYAGRPTG